MSVSDMPLISTHDVRPDRRRGAALRVLLSPRTVQSRNGMLGTVVLGPGEFISEHLHPYSEEYIYVTDGEITVRLNGEPISMSSGDSLFVPVDARHRLENSAGERALVVFALAGLAPRPELGHVDTEEPPGDGAADTGGQP
jgi:putative monooxygenase